MSEWEFFVVLFMEGTGVGLFVLCTTIGRDTIAALDLEYQLITGATIITLIVAPLFIFLISSL